MSSKWYRKWYYIVPAVVVGAPVVIALFVFIGGGIVMLLWNWLLPPIFGWPQITLLQGFGLLMLGRILFGGFGGGGGGGGAPAPACRRRRRRSKNMTPEERERIRGRVEPRTDTAGGIEGG